MFVITYATDTEGFRIHGSRNGVLGVVESKSNVISVMDEIAMDAIQHPYANPFHDNFKVKSTFASIGFPGSDIVAMFGIVCKNDKGEKVSTLYIVDWVEKLD